MLQLRQLTTRSIGRCISRYNSNYPVKWEGLVTKELNGICLLTRFYAYLCTCILIVYLGKAASTLEWTTPEGIKIKPLYTEIDVNKDANKENQAAPGTFSHSLH